MTSNPPGNSDPNADPSAPAIESSSENPSNTDTLPPTADRDRYECKVCGYIYEPTKGDAKRDVVAGTAFAQLAADWRCPVCGARKPQFENIGPKGKASGFEENLGYGLGFNAMPPGQKGLVIFGALALAFLFMLSLYGLK